MGVRKYCLTSSNEKHLSPIKLGDDQKLGICMCSVAWRTIWIDKTDVKWSKGREKQSHRLRREEQSLLENGSRHKTNGACKKRDIQ